MSNITIAGQGSQSVAKHGRNGDTEIAHVTPGEQVIPNSVQTPRLMREVARTFNEAGVPMSRYRVRSTKTSKNPQTGKEEFFLDKLVKGAVGAGVGYLTGGPAGAVAGGLNGAFGGGGSGGGGSGGSGGVTSADPNPLPQPVKFLAQTGGANAGKYLSPTQDITASPNEALMDITSQTDLGTGENPMDALINRITSIRNDETGYQQFADLTPEQKRATDIAMRMNILKPGETATNNLLNTRLKDYSAADQQAYWNAFTSVPSVAPNAPVANSPTIKPVTPITPAAGTAPATTPADASGATPAAPLAPSEVITGIYQAPSNALGSQKYRVMTNSGKSYDVTMDANTGEYKYAAATDLNGYTPLTTRDNYTGGQTPSSSLKLGGANWVKPINVGQSVNTGAPAPAPIPETPPASTTGVTQATPAATTPAPAATQPNNDYIQNDSRYKSLNDDVAKLRSELDASRNQSSASTSISQSTAPTASSTPIITRTSTLSPQRNQRFRGRSANGVSARNF